MSVSKHQKLKFQKNNFFILELYNKIKKRFLLNCMIFMIDFFVHRRTRSNKMLIDIYLFNKGNEFISNGLSI
jgi:hypothetical protein